VALRYSVSSAVRLAAALLGALVSSAAALAGPDWEELANGGGDAGSGIVTAQTVVGMGSLNTVSGSLSEGGFGAGDFQDVYLIRISAPSAFLAATTIAGGGAADFNTQLWLFDFFGTGIVGNDDASTADVGSLLRGAATDGSGAQVTTPGLYYLAISGFDSDPVSPGGAIFDQVTTTEISGPDGPGGSIPLSGWDAEGQTGEYTIVLSGVEFVETCAGDLDFDGQVDADDLASLLGSWGTCASCQADLNDDGTVDSADLAILLGNWGMC